MQSLKVNQMYHHMIYWHIFEYISLKEEQRMMLKAFLNGKVFSLFPRLGMGNIKQKGLILTLYGNNCAPHVLLESGDNYVILPRSVNA